MAAAALPLESRAFLQGCHFDQPAVDAGKGECVLTPRTSLPATKRRHHFEQLESRQMMDGGLTASLMGGTLFINEEQFSQGMDQGVQVAELPDGRIRVTGLEAPG